MKSLRIPIRIKILVTVLFAVTAVVSVITVVMASFFHDDKKTYINDLVSMTAQSTAAEYSSILSSYQQRIATCASVMRADSASKQRRDLLRGLFQRFPELVSVTRLQDGKPPVTIADSTELNAAGIVQAELDRQLQEHPLPLDRLQAEEIVVDQHQLAKGFPVLRISFAEPDAIVTALVRVDGLLAVATRDSAFITFLATPDGTLLAHPDRARVEAAAQADLVPQARELSGAGSGIFTTQYSRDGQDLFGGFAEVPIGGLVAGASIPQSAAFLASREILSKLAQIALLLLAGASALGLIWAYSLTRPLERLSAASGEIAQGRFDVQVQATSGDEFGDLARSFNKMATGLREREDALKTAQSQLIQSEKLAAFGQLGAGIAHEVKNPLAGILGCAQIALKRADPGSVAHTNLQLIEKETRRCKAIIDNLLKFARQEKAAMEPVSVNAVVEDATAIVLHQLEMNQCRLETDLAPSLPQILGNANQLQQVLMNLLINAQQAMEGTPGQVSVHTRRSDGGGVEVHVRDTGPGMTREVLDKIFEPFFTTKPSGRGTGLGLSVSFGIIKDHSGEIAVESIPGRGTTFTISLPPWAGATPDEAEVEEGELVGAGR